MADLLVVAGNDAPCSSRAPDPAAASVVSAAAAVAATSAAKAVAQSKSPSCPSTGIRADERIADHLDAVKSILAKDSDSFEAKFAQKSLLIMQSLLGNAGVSGFQISAMHKFCYDNRDEKDGGKQALLHLGRALRAMAVSRNEKATIAAGFTPDHYGMPAVRPVAPPLKFAGEKTPERKKKVKEEEAEPAVRVAKVKNEKYWGDGPVPLFYTSVGNPFPIPVDEEAERRMWQTSGPLDLPNASDVDCSRLPPVQTVRRHIAHVSELNLSGKNVPRPKPANVPYKPYEYKLDANGVLLVKSEMLGDDDFYDNQVKLRKQGRRYEEIAKMGKYEERMIMKHVGTGNERRRYECITCGIVCKNQHKYASHVRHAHPKSEAERKEAARRKAERAEELREEKKLKEANRPSMPLIEREKRERRNPLNRRSSGAGLSTGLVAAPPSSNKIYTCPICSEEVHSQHVFASHMRYNHPKDPSTTSMAGRRAAVSIKKEELDAAESSPAIDTPERALNALSSVLSATTSNSSGVKRNRMKANGAPAEYNCRVCNKAFDNPNAVAGHTRHCALANGASPSPRAASRQAARALSTPSLVLPVRPIKKEPLPQSPLVASSIASSESADETAVQVIKEVKPKRTTAVALRAIKQEPKEEDEPVEIKPAPSMAVTTRQRVQQATPAAVAASSATLAAAVAAAPAVVATPAAPVVSVASRITRSSLGVAPLVAAATVPVAAPVTPVTNGKVITPTPPVLSAAVSLSTRSSRSSARLLSSPVDSSVAIEQTPTVPPPLKRTRTAAGQAIREVKEEPMEAEERPRRSTMKKEEKKEEKKTIVEKKEVEVIKEIKEIKVEPKSEPRKKETRAAQCAHRGLESFFSRTCPYCGELCTTIHSMDRHIRKKHAGGREEIYACSQCGMKYITIGGLENHWTKLTSCVDGMLAIDGVVVDMERERELRARVEAGEDIKEILENEKKEKEERDKIPIVEVKKEELDDDSFNTGPSTSTSVVSGSVNRSGANRKRKATERFEPDPTLTSRTRKSLTKS